MFQATNIPPFIKIDDASEWHDMGTPDVRVSGSVIFWVRDTAMFEIVAAGSEREWDIYLAITDFDANSDTPSVSDGREMSVCVNSRKDYMRNS